MRAELAKIWTTAVGRALLLALALGGACLLALSGAAPALLRGLVRLQERNPDLHLTDAGTGRFAEVTDVVSLESADYQLSLADIVSTGLFGGAGSVAVTTTCSLLIGVLCATADFRHGGIVLTALVTPNRWRIVRDKVAATSAAIGAAAGLLVLSSATTLAVATAGSGVDRLVPWSHAAVVWARGVVVLVLLGVLGLGLGLMLRNQTLAVGLVLVAVSCEPFVALVARLVTGSVPALVAALPLSAGHLATRGATISTAMDLGARLPPGSALAALATWAAVLLAAGALRTRRSDLV